MKPLVVAITGASGAPYAQRLLRFLHQENIPVHLLMTPSSLQVIREETGISLGESPGAAMRHLERFIAKGCGQTVTVHRLDNWNSPLASGSYQCGPMVIIPCSVHTLAAIANSHSSNLLERRADIMLKERKKLVLVFREAPLNATHLEHLLKLCRMGAHILPAMPGFYHHPKTVQDMVDFVVGRTLDLLEIPNQLFKRWRS